MNNLRQSKFVPMARHALDFKAMRRTQQAVNSLLNGRIQQGKNDIGIIHYSDANMVIELPKPALTELMFPFKIYGIKNASATDIQKTEFSSLGLNINDFTIQIRGGLVGARPYINNVLSGSSPQAICDDATGNFELLMEVNCTDTPTQGGVGVPNIPAQYFYQPFPNMGTTVILDKNQPTLLRGIPAGSPPGTPFSVFNQVALNQISDNNGPGSDNLWSAGFWLEIVDDANNGVYVNLWGIMFADAGNLNGRTTNQFPKGPNIIPLGEVLLTQPNGSGAIVSQVTNVQTGNSVGRFYPGCSTMRGRWGDLYAALPAGLTHLVWYPGDMVVDTTDPITDPSGFIYLKVWQLGGTTIKFNTVSQSPSIADGWVTVGISV